MSDIGNSRFAAVDGGTGGDGPGRAGRRSNGGEDWLTIEERLAKRKAWEAERLRMELLVSQVTAQLLARPIPMTNTADLYAWATDRARNVLAGLHGERL